MDYCISDIHGEYGMLCRLLEKINFSKDDRLFVLGDMIDKGRDSVRVLKLLSSMPNVYCIQGNHEYDFIKYYHSLMQSAQDYDEVLKKLKSCFPYDGDLLDWETVDWLEGLPYYIETEDFIGVHAGIPLKDNIPVALDEVLPEEFVYDRVFKEDYVLPETDKCIVFGHTPTRFITGKDNCIFYPKNPGLRSSSDIKDFCKIHIDSGVYLSGVLSAVRINDCKEIAITHFEEKIDE